MSEIHMTIPNATSKRNNLKSNNLKIYNAM